MTDDGPGYGGWEVIGEALLQVAAEMTPPPKPIPKSPDVLRRIRDERFSSTDEMQRFMGCAAGTLGMVLTSGRRVSIRTAKRWAAKLDAPEFLRAVIDDHVAEAAIYGNHDRRWATSMDIATFRNLYNFYQKALRSGVSAPGDVHHEMGKIYRRLKKAGEVG